MYALHLPWRPLALMLMLAGFQTSCRTLVVDAPDTGPKGGGGDGGSGADGGDGGTGDTGDCETRIFWLDLDGDTYGGDEVEACEQEAGMVNRGGDCDDDNANVHPEAEESCNNIDDDCDGEVDPPGCETVTLDFAPETNLSDANAKLWSDRAYFDAGRRMDSGDVTGDGVGDLLIGTMWAVNYRGGAYVVPGPITESGTLEDAGFWLNGEAGNYEAGRAMGIAEGTGDGYSDVLLGAPDSSAYSVVAYFGPIEADMGFSDADIRLSCTPGLECGHGLDFGDVSGDGIADLVLGVGEQDNGGADSGSVFILHGPLTARTGDLHDHVDLEITGTTAGIETGRKVWTGADLNGDGIGDFIAAASYDSTVGYLAGAVFVAHGPFTEDANFADAAGKHLGERREDYAGETLHMGDVDGDGLGDVLTASFTHDGYAGAVYVVAGPATGVTSLGDADVIIRGEGTQAVGTAASIGDINGDGVGEVLVGASYANGMQSQSGAAFLFEGPLSGTYSTADAPFAFLGETYGDAAGLGAHIGDITGDDLGEVMIGAPQSDAGANDGGAVYVVENGG